MAAGAGVGIGVSGLGIQESWAQHQWFRTVGNENCCSGYISCLSLRPMGSGQVGWRSRRGCRCISRLAYPGLPRLASVVVVVVVVVAHTQSQPYSVRASAAAASSISSITLSRSLAFLLSRCSRRHRHLDRLSNLPLGIYNPIRLRNMLAVSLPTPNLP